MRLWAICIFPRLVSLFCWRKYVERSWDYINRSQTHECGNWGWGRAIPRKGIHKGDFRCSVRGPHFLVPRNLSNLIDRQARTYDTVLVKSREMTGRTQTLPWWLEEEGGTDDRKQNTLAPLISAVSKQKSATDVERFQKMGEEACSDILYRGEGRN